MLALEFTSNLLIENLRIGIIVVATIVLFEGRAGIAFLTLARDFSLTLKGWSMAEVMRAFRKKIRKKSKEPVVSW